MRPGCLQHLCWETVSAANPNRPAIWMYKSRNTRMSTREARIPARPRLSFDSMLQTLYIQIGQSQYALFTTRQLTMWPQGSSADVTLPCWSLRCSCSSSVHFRSATRGLKPVPVVSSYRSSVSVVDSRIVPLVSACHLDQALGQRPRFAPTRHRANTLRLSTTSHSPG